MSRFLFPDKSNSVKNINLFNLLASVILLFLNERHVKLFSVNNFSIMVLSKLQLSKHISSILLSFSIPSFIGFPDKFTE